MKKTILTLVALVAVFALAGCSDDNNPTRLSSGATTPVTGNDADGGTAIEKIMQINVDTGEFSTLLAALKSQSLVQPLVNYGKATVFAPTDAAFAALGLDETNVADLPGLEDILLYHVVAEKLYAADVLAVESLTMANEQETMIGLREDGAYINDSRIDVTDLNAPTGVVHIINAVLLPPTEVLKATIEAMNVDTGEFSTLLAALKSQNLVLPLVNYGKATVFAPTDAAFAALGLDETNVADLPGLEDILLYHVVAEKLYAADVLAVESLTMANEQETMIGLREDGAYINDSRIDVTDLNAPTGVVHIINAVLLP